MKEKYFVSGIKKILTEVSPIFKEVVWHACGDKNEHRVSKQGYYEQDRELTISAQKLVLKKLGLKLEFYMGDGRFIINNLTKLLEDPEINKNIQQILQIKPLTLDSVQGLPLHEISTADAEKMLDKKNNSACVIRIGSNKNIVVSYVWEGQVYREDTGIKPSEPDALNNVINLFNRSLGFTDIKREKILDSEPQLEEITSGFGSSFGP